MKKIFVFLLVSAAILVAHPMGNFSVSHYAKLQPVANGIELRYALDLAEIPTFELLRSWNLDQNSPRADLEKRAAEQACDWLKNLSILINGKRVGANVESVSFVMANGAGNLPIVRITAQAHVGAHGGTLVYEDHNFSDRTGWKEIVVASGAGVTLRSASQSNKDLSTALTQYPPDPAIAPPQDLRAKLEWVVNPVAVTAEKPVAGPVPSLPIAIPNRPTPLGTVVRGDFLSTLLHKRELTPWMLLLALASAFGLGAAHALTPGHGKSIVAAYLVGSRGTLKHAAFLGATVTFTHTITVFALGIASLFLFRYIVPEKITEILGVISGLSIVVVGAWMLYKRVSHSGHSHPHTHHHHHHNHHHHHDHSHAHDHTHAHLPEEISWDGLAALGASGGLVPCESALVLLLGAIALGRVALGLLLLVAFSLGLASVLMTIGVLVLYAKNLIPERSRTGRSPGLHWISIASPALVVLIGMLMTGVSLGWIHPKF